MDVHIKWGIDDTQRVPIAEILYGSLGDKLTPVFGKREGGIPCIASILQPGRILLALENGYPMGIAGLQFSGTGYLDSSLLTLRKHLGWGIFRAMFNGWLLEHHAKKNEIYVDTIAVTEQARGLGIGSKLLRAVIDFSREKGFSYVKLSVIDTNTRAKSFYERMGFREKSVQNVPYPWSRTFGFSSAIEMILDF